MRFRTLAILVLALFTVACDEPPAAPPSDLHPVSVRIDGPNQITVPLAVQYTAIQTWSDGSVRDVTARAQWTSSNPAVLFVNVAGLGRAMATGEVGLTARFDQLTSQPKSVRVAPSKPEWDGIYTLTIGGGTCEGIRPLPPELRERQYTATLRQLALGLSGSVVGIESGEFNGQIFNPQVRFTFLNFVPLGRRRQRAATTESLPGDVQFVSYRKAAYSSTRGFIEVLPDSSRFVVTGEAVTTITPSGFAGTFIGSLALYEPSRDILLGVCSSSSHSFRLFRR